MSEQQPTEQAKTEEPQKELTPEELEAKQIKDAKKKAKEEEKARKKAEKDAKKKAREDAERLAKEAKLEKLLSVVPYDTEEQFGTVEMIKSQFYNKYQFTELKALTEEIVGQEVRVRARLHSSRVKGNAAFIILRKGLYTAQASAFKTDTVPKELIDCIGITSKESIIDIVGTVIKPEQAIESCTQQVEVQVQKFFVISRADQNLPFLIEDASNPMDQDAFNKADVDGNDEKEEIKEQALPTVSLKKRLDTRILDLRVPANKGIFRIQTVICHFFREFFMNKGYIEIHSPKILGGSSEGGAEVFRTDYFGKPASLAQSPQLYKQMALMGDFEGVYEIGPVFRAEDSNTPRHLCEFTGLDFEMEIKESYFEVLESIGGVFNHIFTGINATCQDELKVIQKQFNFEPFLWLEKPLMITFDEGVKLLAEEGYIQDPKADIKTENEKALGEIVRKKFKTDFYILHRYPIEARPFYTMVCGDDPAYTCSYDVFMRGEEIISGAQRVHDTQMVRERAAAKGIDPDSIAYYCDSFKYGASPHGGFGTGLERVTKLFLNLHNVRQTSLFPRAPDRLIP